MKPLALLLGTFMVLGVAAAPVLAQQSGQPAQAPSGQSNQANPPASPKTEVDVKADVKSDSKPADQPSARGDRSGPNVNVTIDKKDQPSGSSRDDGAALPRGAAAGDRTTIFGLSPTAAVVIAAALLVVVILAIVAMSRTGEPTYIDHDRRL